MQENGGNSSKNEGEAPLSAKIEAASADVNTDPTEAQKEAGNYKKGHVQVGSFDIKVQSGQRTDDNSGSEGGKYSEGEVRTRDEGSDEQESSSEESEVGEQREQETDSAPTLVNVIRTLYQKGKDYASKIFSHKFFDVAKTPDFMKGFGITGDKFTIKYGVIARHFGKDNSHDLTEDEWQQLPVAIQNPFAISKIINKESGYRVYTTLKKTNGEYIVVGVDVKNAGRDLEVNAISTVFGRRDNANLSDNEKVIYKSETITPEQQSLLSRRNSDQYPAEREVSDGKGKDISDSVQEMGINLLKPSSQSPLLRRSLSTRSLRCSARNSLMPAWKHSRLLTGFCVNRHCPVSDRRPLRL